MVHRREINGQPVVFGNQGDLWNNAMTWFDHDTGSVWSQVTGAAIMGELAGTELELLPSTLTTWSDWQAQFPDTRALDKFTRENRFRLEQVAVVIAVNGDSLAVPVPSLRDVELVREEVGGVPLVVVLEEGSERGLAFSTIVDGVARNLDLIDGRLVDEVSGESWDAQRGLPDGEQPQLEILPAFSSFPSDYAVFFPAGRVWTPEAVIPAEAFTDSRSPTEN